MVVFILDVFFEDVFCVDEFIFDGFLKGFGVVRFKLEFGVFGILGWSWFWWGVILIYSCVCIGSEVGKGKGKKEKIGCGEDDWLCRWERLKGKEEYKREICNLDGEKNDCVRCVMYDKVMI